MTAAKNEIEQFRRRLAELKQESDILLGRRDELIAQRRDGRSPEQTEAAARELIAGKTMTLIDADAELRDVDAKLKVNAKARDLLADALGPAELREDIKTTAPLFDQVAGHVTGLANLFKAVQIKMREIAVDLRTYEEANGPVAALGVRYPAEKLPYQDSQLDPLRFWWREDFIGDGTNPSKLDRWLEECAELGLKID
jgi:hypothetical protein